MAESVPGRPRRSVRPGSLDPLAGLGGDGGDGDLDPAVVREIVGICGRTDRARALPLVLALVRSLDGAELDAVAVDLGRRARRLVVAVWAAGGEAVFLDGAARLVPGLPAALGPEIGRLLRRRKEQRDDAWHAAAVAAGATTEDLALALGALVESLVDDLALALAVERDVVGVALWGGATGRSG
ncbi:MAG: hypothetical protein AB7Q42_16320 [Acidimicrobiia bacterium]